MSLIEKLGLQKKAKPNSWATNRASRRAFKKKTGVVLPAVNKPYVKADKK